MHDDVHGTAVSTLAAVLVACDQAGIDLSRRDRRPGRARRRRAGHRNADASRPAPRVLASDPQRGVARPRARARDRGHRLRGRHGARRRSSCSPPGVPGLVKPEIGARRPGDPGPHQPRPRDHAEGRGWRAGAAFAADGSLVNNVLGFPGIFRGALAQRRRGDLDRDEAGRRPRDRRADRGVGAGTGRARPRGAPRGRRAPCADAAGAPRDSPAPSRRCPPGSSEPWPSGAGKLPGPGEDARRASAR